VGVNGARDATAPAAQGDDGVQVIVLRGRTVVPGVAEAEALVTRERISGWGGVDPRTGTVVETRHELRGQSWSSRAPRARRAGRRSSTSRG
jgi:predicted aconitase with swiveling domain